MFSFIMMILAPLLAVGNQLKKPLLKLSRVTDKSDKSDPADINAKIDVLKEKIDKAKNQYEFREIGQTEYNHIVSNANIEIKRLQDTLLNEEKPLVSDKVTKPVSILITAFFGIVTIACFYNINFVYVEKNNVVYLDRTLGGEPLPPGASFARGGITSNPFGGMRGPQAEILTPGLHFIPLVGLLYEVDRANDPTNPSEIYRPFTVTANKFATVSTRDGIQMDKGTLLAPEWDNVDDMLDAVKFLAADGKDGRTIGYKGDQLTLVVSAGDYFINRKFFKLKEADVLVVDKGQVGVVRSAIITGDPEACKNVKEHVTPDGVVAVLVPKNCAGVWEDPILPNKYRFHPKAIKITTMSTVRDDVDFLGGYDKEEISFKVNDEGTIVSHVNSYPYKKPDEADSSAIVLRIGGWKVPNDFRLFYQVLPKDAPKAFVTLGNNSKIKKFLVGSSRSIFRTEAQGKDILRCKTYENDKVDAEATKALNKGKSKEDHETVYAHRRGDYIDQKCVEDSRLVGDLINSRGDIEGDTLKAIHDFAEGYGINVISTLMGEPAIPSEWLIPRMQLNYARDLQATYEQEEKAQIKRQKVEEARATANQQATLVTARLKNEAADEDAERIVKLAKAEGQGQKEADIERAAGQRELVSVMGPEMIQEQVLYKLALDAAVSNPDIIKTAEMLVIGGGEGSDAGASLLGTSTLALMTDQLKEKRKKSKD